VLAVAPSGAVRADESFGALLERDCLRRVQAVPRPFSAPRIDRVYPLLMPLAARVRRECLDRMLIFNKAHLPQILTSYASSIMNRAHTYPCTRMRRRVERSNDTETLPLRPFCRGCIMLRADMISGKERVGLDQAEAARGRSAIELEVELEECGYRISGPLMAEETTGRFGEAAAGDFRWLDGWMRWPLLR
jgi:hypothetical protein